METKLSVGFIGCGNMAQAIGGALLKSGKNKLFTP